MIADPILCMYLHNNLFFYIIIQLLPSKLKLFLNSLNIVYRRIEKTAVYEIILQLYQETWVQGLNDPNNLARQNMTDQMLHLVCMLCYPHMHGGIKSEKSSI